MIELAKVNLAAKQRLRGIVSPAVIRIGRRKYQAKDAIIISGYFRSGTTWLAELISKSVDGGIIFEPFHTDHVMVAKEAGFSYNNFRTPGEKWDEGKQLVNDVASGKVLDQWTAAHIPISQSWRMRRLVVKLVSNNQTLVWMTRNTDIRTPILLIRHPCAVLSSWIKRGWRLNKWVVKDPNLIAEYPEVEGFLGSLKTEEEFFAAKWCIEHYVPLMQRKKNEIHVVAYEKLVHDGASYLEDILALWGEKLSDSVRDNMRRPSEKASQQVLDDYGSVLSGWRKSLSKKQVESVLRVVDRFGLGFYSLEIEPDYDRLFGPHPIIQQ